MRMLCTLTLVLAMTACRPLEETAPSPLPPAAVADPLPAAPAPATFTLVLANDVGTLEEQVMYLPIRLPGQGGPHVPRVWRGSATVSRSPQWARDVPARIDISCGGRMPETSEPYPFVPGIVGQFPVQCAYLTAGRWTIRVNVVTPTETLTAAMTTLVIE